MVSKLFGELIIGLCMIIIEVVLYIASKEIPEKSAAYPRVLIILAFILTCAFMSRCVIQIKKEGFKKEEQKTEPGAMLQVLITIVITMLYVIVMPYLGFIISTLLYTAGIMFYLGMRNIFALVLVPPGLTLFGYFIFNNILYIFLPRGVFFG